MTLGFKICNYFLPHRNANVGGIIELDASSSVKFSRHIIVNFPEGYVFPKNGAVSKFVTLMCNYITTAASWNTSDESTLSPDAICLRKSFFF